MEKPVESLKEFCVILQKIYMFTSALIRLKPTNENILFENLFVFEEFSQCLDSSQLRTGTEERVTSYICHVDNQ